MGLSDLFKKLKAEDIDKYISEGREEDLHLDFKTINNPKTDQNDRKNLAKALSGFANADGGFVVWGVDARPDKEGVDRAVKSIHINKLDLFISKLNEFTGRGVNPTVDNVLHRKLPVNDDSGFAVTFVPTSDSGPHMAKLGEDRYYKRSGSSFYKMEHFDIEDMFGRRKKPKLVFEYRITQRLDPIFRQEEGNRVFSILLSLRNEGRGSAHAPFLRLKSTNRYPVSIFGVDGKGTTGLKQLALTKGSKWIGFGGMYDTVIHPGTFLDITALSGSLKKGEDSLVDCDIEYETVAEDIRLVKGTIRISGEDLLNTFHEFKLKS